MGWKARPIQSFAMVKQKLGGGGKSGTKRRYFASVNPIARLVVMESFVAGQHLVPNHPEQRLGHRIATIRNRPATKRLGYWINDAPRGRRACSRKPPWAKSKRPAAPSF